MHNFEDEDMKIVGNSSDEQTTSYGDIAAVAFKLQLESGNIEKAKHLGTLLADKISSSPFIDKVSKHKMILIRFCVTNFITVLLQDETLTHIAVDHFEGAVAEKFGINADDDMVSEMYTVFLIASREKINVAQHIAQTYSRFCTSKGDAIADALAIYDFCGETVSSAIKSLNFVDVRSI